MTARAMYIKSNGKVAIAIAGRKLLVPFEDAAELLAELQVVFHERMLADDWEADDED